MMWTSGRASRFKRSAARWMLNAAHIRAIGLGKREIFSHYNIKLQRLSARRTGRHRQKSRPASSRSHYLRIRQERELPLQVNAQAKGELSCR